MALKKFEFLDMGILQGPFGKKFKLICRRK